MVSPVLCCFIQNCACYFEVYSDNFMHSVLYVPRDTKYQIINMLVHRTRFLGWNLSSVIFSSRPVQLNSNFLVSNFHLHYNLIILRCWICIYILCVVVGIEAPARDYNIPGSKTTKIFTTIGATANLVFAFNTGMLPEIQVGQEFRSLISQ